MTSDRFNRRPIQPLCRCRRGILARIASPLRLFTLSRFALSSAVVFLGLSRFAEATDGTWINTTTGGLWSGPSNWTGGIIADGQDAVADFNTVNITADDTVHLDSPRTVGTLKFGDTTVSNSWLLDDNGDSNDVLTLATSTGTSQIQVNTLTATLSAIVAGTAGLTKSGNGTLALSGANTYSGITSVNAGRVRLDKPLAAQNTTVNLVAANGLTFGPSIGAFTIGGLSGSGGFSLTDTSGIAVALQVGTNNADSTYTGKITGQGSLTKIGSGRLTFAGANAYAGGTTINGGTMQLSGAGNLGSASGTLTVISGTVDLNGNNLSVGPLNGSGGQIINSRSSSQATLTIGSPFNLQFGSYSGTISDGMSGTGKLALSVTGGTIQALHGVNSYGGGTTINGGTMLQINSDSALGAVPSTPTQNILLNSGYLGFDADFTVTPLNSNRSITTNGSSSFYTSSFNVDYAGVISGTGSIGKGGLGMMQLDGVNTYTGNTAVGFGTLKVTGAIARNASDAVSISAGTGFTTASLIRRITPGESFAGFGSTAISSGLPLPGSSADLRQGLNEAASPIDMAMQWRTRGANEGRRLVSNVLNLTGMSGSADGQGLTDPFALQFTYNPAALGGPESFLAANGLIELAWLNTSVNQPNGLWQNATMGNFGAGLPGDVFQNVQSSWDAFASAHSITDGNVGDFLGSFGVDIAHHQVWAVVNHNSQFSVVPEPSAVGLLLIGGLALGGLAVVRRRAASFCVRRRVDRGEIVRC